MPELKQTFSIGSLVTARKRDWIVLPDSTQELLVLKPLGGTDEEITGILTALEEVKPASFSLPDPAQLGDFQSCRLMRDALRLSFRNSAGPFRSFGRLAFDPRPYQLVPLMMALKLNPVRILIADDVGIGKTIEACLIAKELIDRGEIKSLCVLCPPYLTEQWQAELSSKFHIEAELVMSNTVRTLERNCRPNESVFNVFPYTVVSIDFIKSDRHKDEFLRTAPELIIVDEAHIASFDSLHNSAKHQRYDLLTKLSADSERHLILVTATPHSGNEFAFRSLLEMLNPKIAEFPQDLTVEQNSEYRRLIANHFVQRRRKDIEYFMQEKTEFPLQETMEYGYTLSEPYKKLFNEAIDYAREIVRDKEGGKFYQRVRWWSALSLLRALASSPVAAAETMRNRSAVLELETESEAEVDELGRNLVLDIEDRDTITASDILPGSDFYPVQNDDNFNKRKLLAMAKEAEALAGDNDYKLITLLNHLKELIKDGFSPIIFCRFIQTAEYVAEQLRERLPKDIKDIHISAVTGLLPPEEREQRIIELALYKPRILVATDCLSEGINLQEFFDAVVHYDLSWNPTRHEQREGRVDRFGQPHPKVRTLTYYGKDNQIDGIVLDVLLKKHKQIKSDLGISVPVPEKSEAVIEAIFEGLLLKEQSSGTDEQMLVKEVEEYLEEDKYKLLYKAWDDAKEKEKRSRTIFSQEFLAKHADEIKAELDSIRESIGSQQNIKDFVKNSLVCFKADVKENKDSLEINLSPSLKIVKEAFFNLPEKIKVCFELPAKEDYIYLSRTHPLVENLADLVINTALDNSNPNDDNKPKRCGVIRTDAVEGRTVVLLLRYRFHLIQTSETSVYRTLVEDSQLVAFTGSPEQPQWLSDADAKALLNAIPKSNVVYEQAHSQMEKIISAYSSLQPHINNFAQERADKLLASHLRVRQAIKFSRDPKPEIKPELPPDVVGIYLYLPI